MGPLISGKSRLTYYILARYIWTCAFSSPMLTFTFLTGFEAGDANADQEIPEETTSFIGVGGWKQGMWFFVAHIFWIGKGCDRCRDFPTWKDYFKSVERLEPEKQIEQKNRSILYVACTWLWIYFVQHAYEICLYMKKYIKVYNKNLKCK